MTCIVGLVNDGTVYMGGDSAAVDSDFGLYVIGESKLFRTGEYLLGYAGSYRIGQLLQHYAAFPRPPQDPNELKKFLVKDFVNEVRDTITAAGAAYIKNDEEWLHDSGFLLGVAGRLFRIDEDFQVLETAGDFAAIGCGEPIALGALYAAPKNLKPENKLRLALEAAEHFSAGVRGPFVFESI